jgi:hypothetical protein
MYKPFFVEKYTDIREALVYIRETLSRQVLSIPFRDSEIEYIIGFHPARISNNLTFIEYLLVQMVSKRRVLFAKLFTFEEPRPISLNRSLRAMYKTRISRALSETIHKQCITDAFRYSVIPEEKAFAFLEYCSYCTSMEYVILHYRGNDRFEDILEKFLREQSLDLQSISLEEDREKCRPFLRDNILLESWKIFHTFFSGEIGFICGDCYITLHNELQ